MVRFAKIEDLERVNELRKIVNDVHVEGRPDIFKAGFHDELRDFIYDIWDTENKDIIVAERNGVICGFACVQYVSKPESPFMNARTFYDVDEFGVDTAFRRQGVATELIAFIREDAKKRGIDRIELNMWEFNQGALAFYESVGFQTYRRYMELGSD
ncbi:MAG: GNAT family N-acetyltransferase [Lachnospiraceae bacterium]|nr:GNAT family N-acetyltransferase [Lachnospiraceae bacterium]